MKDKFNLSEKIIDLKGTQDVIYQGVLFRNDVKEFIRLLKDVNENIITERGQFNKEYFKIFIDSLIGDKFK